MDLMREDKRHQGLQLPLDQSDLQTQMRVRSYFVPSSQRQDHQQKFGHGNRNNSYCWCIDLDKCAELGLQMIPDEDWIKSLYQDGNTGGELLPVDEWIDPCKGGLFDIVDKPLEEGTQS